MLLLSNKQFIKSRNYIYRNARPLDLARWEYHFEDGGKENVLNALSYYQNNDGGFGHALELDSWNPNSSPIQILCAIEIVKEIDYTNPNNKIIQGIIKYLQSGKCFNNKFWLASIKSNNDYPHAPWRHYSSDSNSDNSYNPTAYLAGFGLCYSEKDSKLYNLCTEIVCEAYNSFMENELLDNTMTVDCYIGMFDLLKQNKIYDLINIEKLENKLKKQVQYSITKDTTKWERNYVCKPSQFVHNKESIFYSDTKRLIEFECDLIINSQLEDGSWYIPWGWGDFANEWAISKNWWKSNGIILNILYLKNFNRILKL